MVLILLGKSGCGKDTILRELVKQYGFQKIVSDTTRPVREGEIDGVDYTFIDNDEFVRRIKDNEYVEYRTYDTFVDGQPAAWYYGCPVADYASNANHVVIFDVDGTVDFVKYVGKENCVVCEITVSREVRRARAEKRGSFDESEWAIRETDDYVRFAKSKTDGVVDFRVDNTAITVGEAAKQVYDMFCGEAVKKGDKM